MSENKSFSVGDYIAYVHVSYNGRGGYDESINYGCVIEELSSGNFAVVKQYGGQIWYGITPKNIIEEKTFFEKFSVYEEYEQELLNNKNKLPQKLRDFVEKKSQERIENTNKVVKKYAQKELLKYTENGYSMSIETFYIEWYVYHVLRSYEPYRINVTLTYCHGASNELQDFMKKNVDFMVNMQFFGDKGDKFMPFLIEEKILEYKYEEGKIDENEFSKKVFPIRIKKLEYKLKFKIKIEDYLINIKFSCEKDNYEFEMKSSELFGTKFVFPYKYNSNPVNNSSKCHKKVLVNLRDSMWKKINKLEKKINKLNINEIKNFNCLIKYDDLKETEKNEKEKYYEIKLLQILDVENNNVLYENKINFPSIHKIIYNENYICSKNKCNKYEIFDLEKRKLNIIEHWSEHSSVSFDSSNKFLIFQDRFSNWTNNILTSFYELRSGKLLGFFEFNYADMMSLFINEVTIQNK